MSHEQKISRQNPGLIIGVLDDSVSMSDNLPGTSDPKYKWVERYFSIILELLLTRCTEAGPNGAVIKPRYYIHVIKYGSTTQLWGNQEMDIESGLEGQVSVS